MPNKKIVLAILALSFSAGGVEAAALTERGELRTSVVIGESTCTWDVNGRGASPTIATSAVTLSEVDVLKNENTGGVFSLKKLAPVSFSVSDCPESMKNLDFHIAFEKGNVLPDASVRNNGNAKGAEFVFVDEHDTPVPSGSYQKTVNLTRGAGSFALTPELWVNANTIQEGRISSNVIYSYSYE
jgi:type 1 fimbria pilin